MYSNPDESFEKKRKISNDGKKEYIEIKGDEQAMEFARREVYDEEKKINEGKHGESQTTGDNNLNGESKNKSKHLNIESSDISSDDLDYEEENDFFTATGLYYSKRSNENLNEHNDVDKMTLIKKGGKYSGSEFHNSIASKYNYFTNLRDLYIDENFHRMRSDLKLNVLVSKFFSELDKFICIANYCLKNRKIVEYEDIFNFSLSWIREAFHKLGLESAKYYVYNSPGPYLSWNRDIRFLMNRYFFSPEFNAVNGFDIEENTYEGLALVDTKSGESRYSFLPYPGFYQEDLHDTKSFCKECNTEYPQKSSIFGEDSDNLNYEDQEKKDK